MNPKEINIVPKRKRKSTVAVRKNKHTQGIILLETLVSLAIISIMIFSLSLSYLKSLEIQQRNEERIVVHSSMMIAIEKLRKEIRNADDIISPAPQEKSSILNIDDSQKYDASYFEREGIAIQDLHFANYAYTEDSDLIRIQFTAVSTKYPSSNRPAYEHTFYASATRLP